ncbi:MAG: hypothetical protein DME99_05580 [Verrucomicrobia bacterium]|nr:MAG: hypothetical protein DME99_05580 [Verrucomicrobiota bacterium]
MADDEGLRLLEFADRRALEGELPILARRLQTNVAPAEHRHLDAIRSNSRLSIREEFRVQSGPKLLTIGRSSRHDQR